MAQWLDLQKAKPIDQYIAFASQAVAGLLPVRIQEPVHNDAIS